jgi:hypothetical protein
MFEITVNRETRPAKNGSIISLVAMEHRCLE